MITPYLALVLVGFAIFMVTLGTVWVRSALEDRREARARQS